MVGHLLRSAVRHPDLHRVRDRGQPRGGDGRAEEVDPAGDLLGHRRGRHLLRHRRVRAGHRVRPEVGGWVASIASGPLFVLGSKDGFGSVNFDRLLQLIVILDILAVGLGTAVATSRGFFAMARDRRIPGVFAKVSEKHGTPVASIVLTVGVCAAMPIWVRWVTACSRERSRACPRRRAVPGVLPALQLAGRVRRVRARGRLRGDRARRDEEPVVRGEPRQALAGGRGRVPGRGRRPLRSRLQGACAREHDPARHGHHPRARHRAERRVARPGVGEHRARGSAFGWRSAG